jgi:hypothetical protein
MMRSTGAYRGRWMVAVLVLLAELGNQWMLAPSARAAGEPAVLFAETGFSLSSPFLDYWQARGGLPSYGYPITEQIVEDGLLVQYFERARFEYHPENAGTRYDVLLTALGTRLSVGRVFAPAGPLAITTYTNCRRLGCKFTIAYRVHTSQYAA